MKAARGRVLVDTNILIYATLEDDPRHARSRDLLLSPGRGERFVSVQNLAEMYPNLTGPKMERPDSPSVARAKIRSIAALPTLQVLPLTGDVQSIAATMITHGIRTLLTENAEDFSGMTEIRAVNPFTASRPKPLGMPRGDGSGPPPPERRSSENRESSPSRRVSGSNPPS